MKTAKLFQNGQSQAVRLPKEFRFDGNEVYIKKMGKMIVLLPINDSWEPLLHSINKFSDDFMRKREQPAPQTRDDMFL